MPEACCIYCGSLTLFLMIGQFVSVKVCLQSVMNTRTFHIFRYSAV